MKKRKLTKVMSLVLTLTMVLGLLPVSVFAAEEPSVQAERGTVILAEGEKNVLEKLGDLLSGLTGSAENGEQGTEEQPAEEQPAEEQPAEEQPAEEQPAEEQPAEEQPAEEQPTEEQPTEEQPTEEQPAEEQPTEEQPAEEQPAEEQPAEKEEQEEASVFTVERLAKARSTANDPFYKIVHVDCGRKYFSPANIKKIIDEAAEAGYNQVELYLSDNQGFRFALNDMKITTATGNTYDLSKALGDGYSDGSKYPDGSGKYLTETEMTDIISYAANKGIDIVPCINTPGHMGAILEEFPDFCYSGSKSSIDLENTEAVAFALAIVEAYAKYFSSQGVEYFNLGADEYANDLSTMGFQGLYTSGKYSKFVQYLNNAAQTVINYGMIPRAFNDGIYYNDDTDVSYLSNSVIHKIQVCYWTSGWSGYNVASASTIAAQNNKLINTHGDYYWVLGNTDWQCSASKASGFKYTSFQGGTIDEPAGAMFCIWCDVGNADGTDEGASVVSKTANVIAAFGATLPVDEVVEEVPEQTVSGKITTVNEAGETIELDETVTVTAAGLTGVAAEKLADSSVSIKGAAKVVAYNITPITESGNYTDSGEVTLPIPEGWDTGRIKAYIVEEDGSYTSINDGTVSSDGESFTFRVEHFSEIGLYELDANVTEEDVVLTVGESTVKTQSGVNNAGNVGKYDTNVATVTVDGKDGSTTGPVYTAVGSYEVSYAGLLNTDADTWQATSYYYKAEDGNYYPLWVKRTSEEKSGFMGSKYTAYTYFLGYGDASSDVTLISQSEEMRRPDYNWPTTITLYTKTSDGTSTDPSTTITITGVLPGETSVKVGDVIYNITVKHKEVSLTLAVGDVQTFTDTTGTLESGFDERVVSATLENGTLTITALANGTTTVKTGDTIYTITVSDKPPANALTGDSVKLEYWITNSMVHESASDSSASSATISSTTAATEEGVDLSSVAPETAYSDYDGWVDLHYWQSMHLDSTKNQVKLGDDQTAAGTTITHVRYYNGAWQYQDTNGVWHYLVTGDQLVAYYVRYTEVTTEITTAMKDWGYGTDGTTPNTSSNKGQVALSVAVVYPDGTLSPAEDDIYAKSTTIVNFWAGRDIGIIAPLENEDYDIARITVVDGTRDNNTDALVWYSSDTITWETETNEEDGSTWYVEETVWDKVENAGTMPMANGKVSNIIWSAKNTAKLVLIYLEPKTHNSNLTVRYWDDTDNTEILNYPVVVAYKGVAEPITFLNGLQQKSDVTVGTFTLDDNAYIVNSSNVAQTFNKNVTTVPGAPAKYKTGLYTYVRAELSEDGKTLTLHYQLNSAALKYNFVLDFGLPAVVPVSKLVENPEEVTNVTSQDSRISSFTGSGTASASFKFTLKDVMTGIEAVTVTLTITDSDTGSVSTQNFTIGFVPATTVYYEEGFATMISGFSAGKTASGNQSQGVENDHYGLESGYYDTGLAGSTSGGKATFDFKGTGVDVYAECTPETGTLMIAVYQGSTLKKLLTVDTSMLAGITDATSGQEDIEEAVSTPVAAISDLAYGEYTLEITQVQTTKRDETTNTITYQGVRPVYLDGFRVYDTMGRGSQLDSTAKELYQAANEYDPVYGELRNAVLTELSVDTTASKRYADQIAKNKLSQVYASADTLNGAVVISTNNNAAANVQDLLDNGPKNELYVYAGQKLVFKMDDSTALYQIGLRGINDGAQATLNNVTISKLTGTDMFYSFTGEVTLDVTSGVVSVTKIKKTSTTAASASAISYAALTADDLVPAILTSSSSQKSGSTKSR